MNSICREQKLKAVLASLIIYSIVKGREKIRKRRSRKWLSKKVKLGCHENSMSESTLETWRKKKEKVSLKRGAVPSKLPEVISRKDRRKRKLSQKTSEILSEEEDPQASISSSKRQPSKDPAHPDYVPSINIDNSESKEPSRKKKKKKQAETMTAPAAAEASEKGVDEPPPVWTSLLNLQPISSEASTSGLSAIPESLQFITQPIVSKLESVSTKANSRSNRPRKILPAPSLTPNVLSIAPTPNLLSIAPTPNVLSIVPTPNVLSIAPTPNVLRVAPTTDASNNEVDPMKLCVIKMEVEDDGYNDVNNAESFIASLASSSSQNSLNNTSNISINVGSMSIKTEPIEETEPSLSKIVPVVKTSTAPVLNGGNGHAVEIFFKNIAQTVMQLPPHLIEETQTKVSALVYEMVIQARNEGYTNV